MKEQLQHTFQRYSEGKLNLREQIGFSENLADPQNADAEKLLNDHWTSQLESMSHSDRDFGYLLDRVHHRIRLKENTGAGYTRWGQTLQRIAAILFLPLLLSFFTYFYLNKDNPGKMVSFAEIQCPLGVRTKFQLPDGSTGYLNSGSKLKYPVQFAAERSVELVGEAYFEVIHNKKSPFHVNTRNLDIKVLGTSFNVMANENEKTEEVVLQTGKVEVSDRSGNQLASLLPNDLMVLNVENKVFTKKVIEASQYSSWKEGKLVFRNENMLQLASRLSRWYNAEVVVDDRQLDDYRFHATFIDEPLDEVLKMISITTPISYREVKRVIDQEGTYQQRKIILSINKNKINQFR